MLQVTPAPAPANKGAAFRCHCRFPFTYKSKVFRSCISVDHTEPWW